MSLIFDILFSQYSEYATIDIILEITAVIFGVLSVLFSKRNNILVFPTGMISTLIFVYLLYKWELLGDMIINAYYFAMSIYGWYLWTRKNKQQEETPISEITKIETLQSIFIFGFAVTFVIIIYFLFNKFNSWVSYIDSITTGIFFVGMWLMAKRKIENWIYWIIGDLISVPLYIYKGLSFSALQYFLFTFLAISGYLQWKQYLNKNKQTLLE